MIKPRPAHMLQVGVFNCCKEEGWTSFISIHGLVSPERTKEHRQVVKRSGTPAMCIKVNRVPEVRRKNLIICPSPPRGSVVGCVLSRGSVLRTSPPACVLSCLRHFLSYDKISLNSCVATNRITAFSASLLGILRTSSVD